MSKAVWMEFELVASSVVLWVVGAAVSTVVELGFGVAVALVYCGAVYWAAW